MRPGGGARPSRFNSFSGVKRIALLHEPGPSLLFAGTGRLFDGDGEIGDLTVDFVARQDVQPGQENGAFENGIGGPVEALEWRMLLFVQNLAVEPGTRGIVLDMRDAKLGMRKRCARRGTGLFARSRAASRAGR